MGCLRLRGHPRRDSNKREISREALWGGVKQNEVDFAQRSKVGVEGGALGGTLTTRKGGRWGDLNCLCGEECVKIFRRNIA